MKTCEFCGDEFEPHRLKPSQKFCGVKCGRKGAPSYNRGRKNEWTERPCRHCGQVFKRSGKNGGAARYCSPECKSAAARTRFYDQRWKHIGRRYGVTASVFESMMERQDGRCAICSLLLDGRGLEVGTPQVDHDHANGKLRAILCRPCNTALGMFRDDPATVERAAAYLRFWGLIHQGVLPVDASIT